MPFQTRMIKYEKQEVMKNQANTIGLCYNTHRLTQGDIEMTKQNRQLTNLEKHETVRNRLQMAPEASNRMIARTIGVSPSFVGRIRKGLEGQGVLQGQVHTLSSKWTNHPYLKEHPELLNGLSEKSLRALRAPHVLDKMQEIGSKSPRYCQRLLYQEYKSANKNPAIKISEQDVTIFQADIRSGLPEIPDNSVDIVFVDPEYSRQAVSTLFSYIGSVSARILKDGGSCLVLTGGAHLDIALSELTKSDKALKFQWNISYICSRATPLIQGRRVQTAVKNIIWLTKSKYKGPIQYDIIEAPPDKDDKLYHPWGQSEQGVKTILERFATDASGEGITVCDFMAGGGSTVTAALQIGSVRKIIASDINAQAVLKIKRRVADLFISKTTS